MEKRIGIIGFGNMGSAIAGQLRRDYQVGIFDKQGDKLKNISGVKVFSSVQDLVKENVAIILAVKPQDFSELLNQIKPQVSLDKLFISIAAGITTGYIEGKLGMVRLVRAMPNLPARVGAGITCICKGKFASAEDLDFSEELFVYLGETMRVEEDLMNAATAVSGSGPAYVSNFLKAQGDKKAFLDVFAQAAIAAGFGAEQARLLTETTFSGTVAFLEKTKIAPEELIRQVTSKGGTTEAAFKVLNQGSSLKEAILAAKKRAEELSRG